jgi:hypothetical protein
MHRHQGFCLPRCLGGVCERTFYSALEMYSGGTWSVSASLAASAARSLRMASGFCSLQQIVNELIVYGHLFSCANLNPLVAQ